MSRKGITCRFRKVLDADLIAATASIGEGELSEMARNGLRLILGIRTGKTLEVRETALELPPVLNIQASRCLPKVEHPPGGEHRSVHSGVTAKIGSQSNIGESPAALHGSVEPKRTQPKIGLSPKRPAAPAALFTPSKGGK